MSEFLWKKRYRKKFQMLYPTIPMLALFNLVLLCMYNWAFHSFCLYMTLDTEPSRKSRKCLILQDKFKLIFNSMLLCVIVLDTALNLRTTESWKLERIFGGDLVQPALL